MSSEFGKLLRVSLFGQSHGPAVGVLMDGLPAGEEIDLAELQAFLDRRRAKGDGLSTARREADVPRFLAGVTFPAEGDSGGGGNAETGAETGAEAGAETGVEAGAETGVETGAEAGAQTGAETGVETGADRRANADNRFDADIAGSGDGRKHADSKRTAVTCGFPLCMAMDNADRQSEDYAALDALPRPGHADYTAFVKWKGFADMRGGGHFSGRLTAPLCAAGGIAKQILARRGIAVGAHLSRIARVQDAPFPARPSRELLEAVGRKPFPVLDDAAGARMRAAIAQAGVERDSVGGVVECAASGLPAGLGGPFFDGVESRLAAALFGIPAVKGVEFGAGFQAADLRGSENNDPFTVEAGRVATETNHSGGILGGITTGMPVLFRAAFKPTPSISREQRTVNLRTMEPAALSVQGRHDPCAAHRAVPVVEAVTACVLLDLLLENGAL